jgi:hypothetical protein
MFVAMVAFSDFFSVKNVRQDSLMVFTELHLKGKQSKHKWI